MSKTGQCGLNPSESSSLRSLKIACRAPKMSRVTTKMVLFCLNAFSKLHGRSPDRTTVHFKHYWWWATILHDVTDRWLVFGHARAFHIWHGRSLPRSELHAWFLGRSVPRSSCVFGYARPFRMRHGRSIMGWPAMPCTQSCTVRSPPGLSCLSDMHGRAYGRMTVPNAQVSFLHRIFAALSFCPESPRFRYHLVWYAVLGL